jgi:hypothetical protein
MELFDLAQKKYAVYERAEEKTPDEMKNVIEEDLQKSTIMRGGLEGTWDMERKVWTELPGRDGLTSPQRKEAEHKRGQLLFQSIAGIADSKMTKQVPLRDVDGKQISDADGVPQFVDQEVEVPFAYKMQQLNLLLQAAGLQPPPAVPYQPYDPRELWGGPAAQEDTQAAPQAMAGPNPPQYPGPQLPSVPRVTDSDVNKVIETPEGPIRIIPDDEPVPATRSGGFGGPSGRPRWPFQGR